MPTIFSKIIRGEIPCYRIAEDDYFLAFLDAFPIVKGHTLIIPKRSVDNFFDLTNMELAQIMAFARPIAQAIQKTCPCIKCAMSVVGLEVPHAHVHLVPINEVGDMNFTRPKPVITPDEMRDMQQKIMAALAV